MKRMAFKFVLVITLVMVAAGSGKVGAQGPVPAANGGQSPFQKTGQADGPLAVTAGLQVLPEKAAAPAPTQTTPGATPVPTSEPGK